MYFFYDVTYLWFSTLLLLLIIFSCVIFTVFLYFVFALDVCDDVSLDWPLYGLFSVVEVHLSAVFKYIFEHFHFM